MVGKLQLRARTAPFPSLVTGILTLPCASLGLAAINNIRDWQVAEKKLLQPTQMSQLNPCVSLCLWRERSKVFWRMKDESTLDSFSPCINDVHKEKLPYSMRQDMTGQQISFQIYSTSDLMRESLIWSTKYLPVIFPLDILATLSKDARHGTINLFFYSTMGGENWLQFQVVDRVPAAYVRKAWH